MGAPSTPLVDQQAVAGKSAILGEEKHSGGDLSLQMNALQQQLLQIQRQLSGAQQQQDKPQVDPTADLFNQASGSSPLVKGKQFNRRQISFQPMRRMVSWQPMKKSVPDYSREQMMKAIEDQLAEILHAGEQLGVSADDILAHLRRRNSVLFQPYA